MGKLCMYAQRYKEMPGAVHYSPWQYMSVLSVRDSTSQCTAVHNSRARLAGTAGQQQAGIVWIAHAVNYICHTGHFLGGPGWASFARAGLLLHSQTLSQRLGLEYVSGMCTAVRI